MKQHLVAVVENESPEHLALVTEKEKKANLSYIRIGNDSK
jgi:hypothetical protein